MIDLGATIDQMKASGMTSDEIVRALACLQLSVPVAHVRSAGADRQARYRERHKASQSVTSDALVTDKVSPKEVSPTPLQEITLSNPTTHKETPLRGSKKGSRLPSDFDPDIGWAVAEGLPRSEAVTESAQFRDFWMAKAGGDACKLDWPATWRRWVREAIKRRPRSRAGPQPRGNPTLDAANALMEKLNAVSPSQTEGNLPPLRLVAYGSGAG